jgi:signal transduction histidine kinase
MFIAPESHAVVEGRRFSEEEKPYEILGIKKDGSTIWVEVIANKVPSEGPSYRVVAVRDISERKRAEERLLAYQEQLRSMASELSITEERERRRMAALLHDSIGQALAFCKIKVGALQQKGASGEVLEKQLREIRELLEQAIRSTRTLTFDLSPPVLHEIGIEPALEALAERIQEQHGIRCTFRDDGSPKSLWPDLRTLLYHAARELLTNVVKHARAGNVAVSIRSEDNSIMIEVCDDGVGFAQQGTGGFGLFSIRERLRRLGGRLEIEPGIGRGTRAVIIAPCRKEGSQ